MDLFVCFLSVSRFLKLLLVLFIVFFLLVCLFVVSFLLC